MDGDQQHHPSDQTLESHPASASATPEAEEAVVDIPNSEVVIARTVRRDNSSEYRIDGNRATVKEVADLLRCYHVDIDHNRFLILQVCRASAV